MTHVKGISTDWANNAPTSSTVASTRTDVVTDDVKGISTDGAASHIFLKFMIDATASLTDYFRHGATDMTA